MSPNPQLQKGKQGRYIKTVTEIFVKAGNEDELYCLVVLANLLRQLHTASARHFHVKEQNVEVLFFFVVKEKGVGTDVLF